MREVLRPLLGNAPGTGAKLVLGRVLSPACGSPDSEKSMGVADALRLAARIGGRSLSAEEPLPGNNKPGEFRLQDLPRSLTAA